MSAFGYGRGGKRKIKCLKVEHVKMEQRKVLRRHNFVKETMRRRKKERKK